MRPSASRLYMPDLPLDGAHGDASTGSWALLRWRLRVDATERGAPEPAADRGRVLDTVAHGLGLRPAQETDRLPQRPPTVAVRVTWRVPPALLGTRVASDERGTLWRGKLQRHGPAHQRWIRDGYVLDVPCEDGDAASDGASASDGAPLEVAATLHVRAPGRHAMERRVEASSGPLAYGIRHALTVLLPRLGVWPLHAAAVRTPGATGATLLLVGSSGCGKSTLAAGLVGAGHDLISDDLVALGTTADAGERPSFDVLSLTRGLRLLPDAVARLGVTPQPAASLPLPLWARAKHHVAVPGLLRPGRVHTIVFPSIADRPTSSLCRLPVADALPLLAAQMMPPALLAPHVAHRQTRTAVALLASCTCWMLAAGHDLRDDPGRLAARVRNARASPEPSRRPVSF